MHAASLLHQPFEIALAVLPLGEAHQRQKSGPILDGLEPSKWPTLGRSYSIPCGGRARLHPMQRLTSMSLANPAQDCDRCGVMGRLPTPDYPGDCRSPFSAPSATGRLSFRLGLRSRDSRRLRTWRRQRSA